MPEANRRLTFMIRARRFTDCELCDNWADWSSLGITFPNHRRDFQEYFNSV